MTCEIVKNDTCVLLPREYAKLRESMNPTYRAICDVLLHSGMRIEEFWAFVSHPDWYRASRRCINLPKEAVKKKRCLTKGRDVILSVKGCEAVEFLIGMKLKDRVSRQWMGLYLNRVSVASGIGRDHICPKMFRKSVISWLVACYPERSVWINASAGHTADIQLRHYIGIAFERRDVEDMREMLKGWGET